MAEIKPVGGGLTSIVRYPDRGPYGNNRYRGNCSGYLIRDLLDFFTPKRALDPMQGSGTTGDVCRELGIPYVGLDLKDGFDLLKEDIPCGADFIFFHPPYHTIIQYSGSVWGNRPNPADLSRCRSWREFVDKIDRCSEKLISCLRRGGVIAYLIGDIRTQGRYFSMARDITWYGAPLNVLIKVQENATSYRNKYSGRRFIPIVHETVLIFKREDCYIIPVRKSMAMEKDIRQATFQTWRDVVAQALEALGASQGQGVSLKEIYAEVEGHVKCRSNRHWREKIRQTLRNRDFNRVGDALYALVN